MSRHEFGDIIPTIPKTRKCKRCGGYVIAEKIERWNHDEPPLRDPDLLPLDMRFINKRDKCQKSQYTEYELQESMLRDA